MALTRKQKSHPTNLDSFIEQKPVVDENIQAFSVKLPLSLHREIKKFALEKEMTLKDLFLDMYAFYRDNK